MTINYPPADIPLHQKRFEFEWLLRIFVMLKPHRVLELGAASGGSVWGWAHNCQSGTQIVAVDQYHPSYDNRSEFPKWEKEGRCSITAIQGQIENPAIIKTVKSYGPYDWLFIDADHHYDAVLRDWDNYQPMVVPGGVIALHDTTQNAKADIEVFRLWNAIQRDHWKTISIQEDFNSDTCGIGVVFKL